MPNSIIIELGPEEVELLGTFKSEEEAEAALAMMAEVALANITDQLLFDLPPTDTQDAPPE